MSRKLPLFWDKNFSIIFPFLMLNIGTKSDILFILFIKAECRDFIYKNRSLLTVA